MREQSNANDKNHFQDKFMSTQEIITLARAIVKREPVKMPQLKGWELSELMWWIDSGLDGALI